MKINSGLTVECGVDGRSSVSAWFTCHSQDDIDDLIAWLELAKTMMIKWEEIRSATK